MILELIRNEDNKVIGWSLEGESGEDMQKLRAIRDLSFWGLDDTAVEYNGRAKSNDDAGNPGILSWKQKKYIKH